MNVIEAEYKRRSVRKYLDKPVEREKIDTLLKAAMAAPSARNSQPWHFFVIEDQAQMERLRTDLGIVQYNAPNAIIVCGNLDNEMRETVEKYWQQDCSAALMNMLNAAVELGLGTVWQGGFPNEARTKPVIEYLGLNEDMIPLAVICLGYPAEDVEVRTQYDGNKVTFI